MYGKLLEIENAVFPENIVFSPKNIVFFVGMTFSSVFEAPGTHKTVKPPHNFGATTHLYPGTSDRSRTI